MPPPQKIRPLRLHFRLILTKICVDHWYLLCHDFMIITWHCNIHACIILLHIISWGDILHSNDSRGYQNYSCLSVCPLYNYGTEKKLAAHCGASHSCTCHSPIPLPHSQRFTNNIIAQAHSLAPWLWHESLVSLTCSSISCVSLFLLADHWHGSKQ